MVLLQEDDYPILPGYTPAESALLAHLPPTAPLAIVPDQPAVWLLRHRSVVFLDPQLIDLGRQTFGSLDHHWHDPTSPTEGPVPLELQAVLLWLTPATAARLWLLHDPELPDRHYQVQVEEEEIRLSVSVGTQVVGNQLGLRSGGRRLRLLIDPAWEGAEEVRGETWPEEEDHYVQIDCYSRVGLEESGLGTLDPTRPLGGGQSRAEHIGRLTPEAAARLEERWGECGLCGEALQWGHVYGCCQYPVCGACYCRCPEDSRDRCPHCRGRGLPVPVTEEDHPRPTEITDVLWAIHLASPGARVLLARSRPTGITQVEEVRVEEGELRWKRVSGPQAATHLVCEVPLHGPRPAIASSAEAPLQVYWVGTAMTATIRAALATGALQTPERLTVLPLVYRPSPMEAFDQVAGRPRGPARQFWERCVLHYTSIVWAGSHYDCQLGEVLQRAELIGRRTRKQPDPLLVDEITGRWSDQGVEISGRIPVLRLGSQCFNLRRFWCLLDPQHRQYLGDDPVEEDSSDETVDSDSSVDDDRVSWSGEDTPPWAA